MYNVRYFKTTSMLNEPLYFICSLYTLTWTCNSDVRAVLFIWLEQNLRKKCWGRQYLYLSWGIRTSGTYGESSNSSPSSAYSTSRYLKCAWLQKGWAPSLQYWIPYKEQGSKGRAECSLDFTTHLMGLSFLQKFDQVCAAKTIKVRTKRNRATFVLSLKDNTSPL